MSAFSLSLPSRILRALPVALRRFGAHKGAILASHVAMSLMLALFPFLLCVVALAGAVSGEVDVDQLIVLIFGAWPDAIAAPLASEVRAVIAAGSVQLVTLGGALAVYFASNGVDAVRIALSQAYRDSDPRPFWQTRLIAVAFVLGGAVVVLAALTLGVALPAYLRFAVEAVPGDWAPILRNYTVTSLLALLVLGSGVAACHVWLPGLRHGLREIWPGVLLTLVLWGAAARGFAIYMSLFADYGATYAGLAGAMAALIFLYLMAAILILGAEFNGALNLGDQSHGIVRKQP